MVAAAPVTGGLPLINTTEKIGPGINLQHVQALDQNGWYNARFLNVPRQTRPPGIPPQVRKPAVAFCGTRGRLRWPATRVGRRRHVGIVDYLVDKDDLVLPEGAIPVGYSET
jgi:hypothetical protein